MEFKDILEIAISVLNAICLVFCFGKMGIDCWAAIIPIYGEWCLYECVFGRNKGWMSLLSLVPVLSLFALAGGNYGIGLLITGVGLVSAIISAVAYWKMFRGFGKSVGFCIFGMIFTPIAIAICAFDGSKFYG